MIILSLWPYWWLQGIEAGFMRGVCTGTTAVELSLWTVKGEERAPVLAWEGFNCQTQRP